MIDKLSRESSGMKALEVYFQESTRICEQLSNSMVAVRSKLSEYENGSDTLQTALKAVSKELGEYECQVMQILRTLNQDVIEPLDIFREHYDNNGQGFIKEAQSILAEIDDAKRKTLQGKDAYFKSAARLEKTQTTLKAQLSSPAASSTIDLDALKRSSLRDE